MFGFFRRLKAGNQLMSSLISGRFDDSELGMQLSSWFAARPTRVTQRDMFIPVIRGMGAKPESIATRLMDCIMKSWSGGQFGDLLALQLDDMITFDPPRDSDQEERQRNAKLLINELKEKLRALDGDLVE